MFSGELLHAAFLSRSQICYKDVQLMWKFIRPLHLAILGEFADIRQK